MSSSDTTVIVGRLVDGEETLSLEQLVALCGAEAAQVLALLHEGVIEAASPEPRFGGIALRRARLAIRLQRDLGVNLAGAALVVDLLERIRVLEGRPDR